MMALPPPKLLDLNSFIEGTNSKTLDKQDVWEIGVPAKNSLYWSIVLSYLFLSKDDEFPMFLDNLTSLENEANVKRARKSSQSMDFRVVRNRLKNFNPFKNRYVFFYDEKMINVFRTFKSKLNKHADKMKTGDQPRNDDLRLNSAAVMLNCKIDVYFPDEKENKVCTFPPKGRGGLDSKITIFQYKDRKHGSRKENINIFRFAMPVDYANLLKLSALPFILKKAKFSIEERSSIKQLMSQSEAHGTSFLPTILQSSHFRLMTGFYKSPYIALKLSEAGFETNPVKTEPEKPSSLLLSMTKADSKFFRILYDYAVNCRYLFDRSVREADETVLDSLKMVRDILVRDGASLNLFIADAEIKERVLITLGQFSKFNDFQINIASTIKDLRQQICNEPQKEEVNRVRKQLILQILEYYLEYFYFDKEKVNTIQEKYFNYISNADYYEKTDYFTCLSFFDSILTLKRVYQLKNDIYTSVELNFFLLLISNKYFPKFKHAVRCNTQHDEVDCEKKKNVLHLIPLLYREKLKTEVNTFLGHLKRHEESEVLPQNIKEEKFNDTLSTFPEIRDELLISRIQRYLKAALAVSFEEDGIKGIFVIERALQVLGESIKPQSTKGCVASCLLGSRLPSKLRRKLINIRDDLSHYRHNSVEGRLSSENDEKLFVNLQNELKKIAEAFEIVAFTQYLRLEESLMNVNLRELEKTQIDQTIIEMFQEENKNRLHKRKVGYVKYNTECIKLSFEAIKDVQDYLDDNLMVKGDIQKQKLIEQNIVKKLISIEYLFLFMIKMIKEECFKSYLTDVKDYREKFQKDKKIEDLRFNIHHFRVNYIKAILENSKVGNIAIQESENLQYPVLIGFFDSLKRQADFKSGVNKIMQVIEVVYKEAHEAKEQLEQYIKLNSFGLSETEELLLQKLIILPERLKKLREYFETMNEKLALRELNKKWITKDFLIKKVQEVIKDNCAADGEVRNILLKISYQKYLPTSIYSSSKLDDQICSAIGDVLNRKVTFLLRRMKDIQAILIDEDEEIKAAWQWGRSKGMQYHMRFLMRERFLREMSVRASLEMAFLDCLNILERDDLKNIYEKLNNLFTGINLRNVLSHGHNVLETVGGLLDEDDLPSELINKMLNLVEDSDAIERMLELIQHAKALEKERFESWIENYNDEDEEDTKANIKIAEHIKVIVKCPRWKSYLFLMPLM